MITAPLGSKRWIEQVRSTKPVRQVLSRSRATHQFAPYLESVGRNVPCEGGNEATCALFLDILATEGLVKWWKEQPFELTKSEHGIEATPDAIFEWFTGAHFVLETKSAKFVTAQVEEKATALEKLFAKAGLTYLFWTDAKHVGRPLHTNVRSVWYARDAQIEAKQVSQVVDLVRKGPVSVLQVLKLGVPPEAYRHAIAHGKVHCNLTKALDESALLYPEPLCNAYDVLLGSGPDPESWWNSLPDSQHP